MKPNYDIGKLMDLRNKTCPLCGEKLKRKYVEMKTKTKFIATHFCKTMNGTCKVTGSAKKK